MTDIEDSCEIVLLTNDADNRKKAQDEGLVAYTSEWLCLSLCDLN